ncbi:MAG TPA: hypothetical protein VJR23_14610 [Candidatus Acidoferrales bacterium]|nr:hypothetical protein [Candidatus Acidoferrales bacterium]
MNLNAKNRLQWAGLAIASAMLFVPAAAQGQEKHIQKSELPAAVQKTAESLSQGATVRGYTKEIEDGKTEYEVEMTVNGHARDVSISPSGEVLEVEDTVEIGALPASVREALQKKAGAGKVRRVESITKHGKIVAYEAHIVNGAKRSEAQVGPNGEKLDHEE